MTSSSTQVTIEDLGNISDEPIIRNGQPLATPSPVKPLAEHGPVIDDLGAITFAAPPAHQTLVASQAVDTDDEETVVVETQSSETIIVVDEPDDSFAQSLESDRQFQLDLAATEKILDSHLAQLRQFAKTLSLHKDDFAPGLVSLLDTLTNAYPEYDAAVSNLNQLFADQTDLSTSMLEKKLRTITDKVAKTRANLENKVDQLIDSFPIGNNWYRLLAAWEILITPEYSLLVSEKNWLIKLSDLALILIGQDQKAQLLDLASHNTSYLASFFTTYFAALEQQDITFTPEQRNQLIFFLTPILQEFVSSNAPAVDVINSSLAEKIDILDAQLKSLSDTKIKHIDEQLTDLSQQHTTISALDEKLASLIQDKNEVSTRQQETSIAVKKNAQELDDRFTLLVDKLETLKLQQQTKQEAQEQEIAKLVAQTHKLSSELARLQEANSQLQELQQQLSDYRTETAQQQEQIELHQQQAKSYLQQLTQVQAQNQTLAQKNAALLDKQQEIASRAQADADQLQTLTQQVTKLESANQQLQTENSRLITHQEAITAQAESEAEQLESLSQQLTQVQAQNQTLSEQNSLLSQQQDKLTALQTANQQLQLENEELRITNAGLKQANWQAERQHQPLSTPITSTASRFTVIRQPAAADLDNLASPLAVSPAPVTDLPAPMPQRIRPVSSLQLLQLGKKRLTPHSPLLTGQPLSFVSLKSQITKALAGLSTTPAQTAALVMSVVNNLDEPAFAPSPAPTYSAPSITLPNTATSHIDEPAFPTVSTPPAGVEYPDTDTIVLPFIGA